MNSFLSRFRYHLILHLIVFIWGFTGILGGLITISAISLVWYRILIAVFVVGAYMIFTKRNLLVKRRHMVYGLGAGVVIALHWVFFYQSIKVSTISISVVCLSFATFFSALLEPLFFKRKIYSYELIFGLLVVLGLVYIFSFSANNLQGVLYGVISAALSALFAVLNGKLARNYETISLAFYELIGGFVVLSFYMLLSKKFSSVFFTLSHSDIYYLLVLGIICTAFPLVGSVSLMKKLSPYTVVITTNLEPVYTILLAYYIFGEKERMNAHFYGGAVFILLILFANAFYKSRAKSLA